MHDEQLIKFRSCPLCGTMTISVVGCLCYALFDDSPLSNSYNLVACSNCGFIFCDTKSTAADFYSHYKQNLHYMTENRGTGALNENEGKRYASVFSILQKYQPNKKVKIIDIGSAKGGFLSFLKTQGYKNLLAIDLLSESIDYARANGIDAKIGSAEQLPLKNDSIDVVVLSHVLEHILDLRAVMTELCRVVVDGGLVYAEVPSIEYGCSFKNAPMWDFLYEHINYFSKHHLISLFESKHFSCLESNIKELHNENGVIKCVWAIFKKNIYMVSKNIEYFDIKEKISDIPGLLENLDFSKLTKIIEEKKPCYVWGISAYLQLLVAMTPIGKCNIVYFLDKSKYKQTKTINKIPIKSPEILKKLSSEAVVIFPAEPYANSMNQYLDRINFLGRRIII
jgi:SAM-dependent methyltransferase